MYRRGDNASGSLRPPAVRSSSVTRTSEGNQMTEHKDEAPKPAPTEQSPQPPAPLHDDLPHMHGQGFAIGE
jgi:hypothetical protein